MQRRETRELFYVHNETLVFQRAMQGKLRESSIRGLCWRYFVGALSGRPEEWPAQVAEQQVRFDELCAEHCVELDRAADAAIDVSVHNPLSCDETSPYTRYFAGNALCFML